MYDVCSCLQPLSLSINSVGISSWCWHQVYTYLLYHSMSRFLEIKHAGTVQRDGVFHRQAVVMLAVWLSMAQLAVPC